MSLGQSLFVNNLYIFWKLLFSRKIASLSFGKLITKRSTLVRIFYTLHLWPYVDTIINQKKFDYRCSFYSRNEKEEETWILNLSLMRVLIISFAIFRAIDMKSLNSFNFQAWPREKTLRQVVPRKTYHAWKRSRRVRNDRENRFFHKFSNYIIIIYIFCITFIRLLERRWRSTIEWW